MKKMILTALLATTSIFACFEETNGDDNDSSSYDIVESENYSYLALKYNFRVPSICYGYRAMMSKEEAFDVSVGYSSTYYNKSIDMDIRYVDYYKKNKYIASGISLDYGKYKYEENSYFYNYNIVGISPVFSIGTDNHSIKELNVSFPRMTNKGVSFVPSINIKYGFKF